MRNVIISLLLLMAVNLNATEWNLDNVLDKRVTLESDSSITFKSVKPTLIKADTLSFYAEVLLADSLRADNPLSGDSLDIDVRVIWSSSQGVTDTTTWDGATQVLTKGDDQGQIAFGSKVDIPASATHAYVYVKVVNNQTGTQSATIRVYKIRAIKES